jgi:raffinose/stachyose/melibiose transport system permease protein
MAGESHWKERFGTPHVLAKRAKTTSLYGALIVAALVTVVPLIWIATAAFKDSMEVFLSPYSLPEQWRWENFSDAWTNGRFNTYFMNTVLVAIPTVTLTVVLASMAGYSLAKLKYPGRGFLTTLMILGLAIPVHSLIIPLYYVLRSIGLLGRLGGISISIVGIFLPFGIMLLRSFFKSIDPNYMEAGRMDGCSEFTIFARIMMPLAQPAVLSLIVLDFMWAWKAFLIPMVVTTQEDKRVVGLALMYFRSQHLAEYGMLAAAVLISSVPILVIYILFNRYFVEGLTQGGLKG